MVKGVSLTGSDKAGSAVGKLTGKYIKKILELGGSDAFIVCEDADIVKAAKKAVMARMLNTGQSCIAAKKIYHTQECKNKFINQLIHYLSSMKIGDPMLKETQIGPLARKRFVKSIEPNFR